MLESKISYPSRAAEACCTCARLLPSPTTATIYSPDTEKPRTIYDRRLPCCERIICAECIANNQRYETYCPFCQISTSAGALPKEGLREPPGYGTVAGSSSKALDEKLKEDNAEPPSYEDVEKEEKGRDGEGDIIHHLLPTDTIPSLSLLYNLSPTLLRSHNKLTSDHLLHARNTIRIPRSAYSGPSLSPKSHLSDEDIERRRTLRRFMVAAKVSDYDIAKLYLEDAGWEEGLAMERWREDAEWEREHPLEARQERVGEKVKGREGLWKRRFMGQSSKS